MCVYIYPNGYSSFYKTLAKICHLRSRLLRRDRSVLIVALESNLSSALRGSLILCFEKFCLMSSAQILWNLQSLSLLLLILETQN